MLNNKAVQVIMVTEMSSLAPKWPATRIGARVYIASIPETRSKQQGYTDDWAVTKADHLKREKRF